MPWLDLRAQRQKTESPPPPPEFPGPLLPAVSYTHLDVYKRQFPHTEALREITRLVTANHVPQKDTWRITLTWPVIDHASSVFFLIAGEDKAAVLKEVLTGPRDPERLPSQLIWPASGILTFILDKAAAALLPATDGEGCGFLERER